VRSSNQRYLYPVDHLRAFAAVLVLLYHSSQLITANIQGRDFEPARDWLYSRNPVKTLVFEGHTGVALFMVLSGFIFTTGTLGTELDHGRFLLNRLLRIYPMYLVLLFIGVSTAPGSFTLSSFVQVLLPLANFGGPVGTGGIWGAMFWAVSVELQFYLVFPLLLRLLHRGGPVALVRLVAGMIVLRVLVRVAQPGVDLNSLTYYSLVGRLDQFLVGMLAAWVFVRHRSWVLATVAVLWAFNQLHGFVDAPAWRVVWVDVEGVLWAAVVLTYVVLVEHRRGSVTRAVAKLGEVSFSFYLLHFAVVAGVVTVAHGLVVRIGGVAVSGILSGLLVATPITLAVALVTYHAVEKPFLALRVRYVRVPAVEGDAQFGPAELAGPGAA
jgi:peptidoglycan/LPS O-acetylase OafA/YrhL